MSFIGRKLVQGLLTASIAAAMMSGAVYAAEEQEETEMAVSDAEASEEEAETHPPLDAPMAASVPAAEEETVPVDDIKPIDEAISTAREETASETQTESASGATLVVAAPNEYLNVHSDASLSSDVVGKLYTNDVAAVIQDNGDDWVKIQSGGVVGYVLGEYLVTGEEAEVLTDLIKQDVATVDSESEDETDVYSRKDEDSRVMTTISKGAQYTLEETDEDGWTTVVTDEGTGYVRSESVTVGASYPVAQSSDEIKEIRENSTVVDIADEAQKRADNAQAIADAAYEKAEEAMNGIEDMELEEGTSSAAARAAQTLGAVSEIAQKNADASKEHADFAKENMQNHRAEMGQAVADFAVQFVGNPYVWGGSSLTHGTDCSGFTMAVYANFGIGLPHYDASQRGYGIGISSLSDARPGDLVCYYGHVGIYIGDGQIVHAANARDGIKISNADYREIACIRRLFY